MAARTTIFVHLANALSDAAPTPQWSLHRGLNCYSRHGAVEMEQGNVSLMSLDMCKKLCEVSSLDSDHAVDDRSGRCQGVTIKSMATNSTTMVYCYRRAQVNVSSCETGTPYDTLLLAPSPAPAKTPVSWTRHPGVNCWEGHGAKDLESERGVPFAQIHFAECKAMCNLTPGCDGITFRAGVPVYRDGSWGRIGDCYRRASINITECYNGDQHKDLEYDTWVKLPAADFVMADDVCESLPEDECMQYAQCRLCGAPGYAPQSCLSQSKADQYLPRAACRAPLPEYNPCSLIDKELCVSWEKPQCRACVVDAGKVPFYECLAEVPVGFPGHCSDDAAHHDVYKAACSELDAFRCSEAPLCTMCDLPPTFKNATHKLGAFCIDKDDFPIICNKTRASLSIDASHRDVMI